MGILNTLIDTTYLTLKCHNIAKIDGESRLSRTQNNKSVQKARPNKVDVIIPVYRDLAVTQRCVESVLAAEMGPRVNLIVIDDASPDPEVVAYCDGLRDREGVTVLRNAENKGFVATVNIGMQENVTHDVLLLNSDTEVGADWLVRMQACAYREKETGTVTPFSNNGTLCSYPRIIKSNALPDGYDVVQMQTLFASVHGGKAHTLPTAVGFCMYIRRDCLDDVGYFDEESFGRGYGEESDFSMRAIAAGWQNQLAADVFVYHQGGVSFSTETQDRIQAAEKMMATKHPSYTAQVMMFLARDPLCPYRDLVDDVLAHKSKKEAIAVLTSVRQYRDDLQKDVAEYYKQKNEYITLLSDTRADFSRTDQGLLEAQQLVEKYEKAFVEQQSVLEERKQAYERVATELATMENSRSWRYTKWIRTLLAKLGRA